MSGFRHESTKHSVEWLTPLELIESLGSFDLDPCAAIDQANGKLWATAQHMYTVYDDGLVQPWSGRVFVNPPYDKHIDQWIERLIEHGNGILLIYARTDTRRFHQFIWPTADAIMFVRGRIKFYNALTGVWGPAGAPHVLVAFGENNVQALYDSGIAGAIVRDAEVV